MSTYDVDLLTIDHGAVVAPAGCGKTQLIAEALGRHSGSKPILVLTHTNCGVAALRDRLDRDGVASSSYRLSTIDGMAMRLISSFPFRSEHDPAILTLSRPDIDYPEIRRAAASLLESGHVNEIISASFDRLIVDEYQDCSLLQHRIVAAASESLPTCILGDALQAIFGFGNDRLASWHDQVCRDFPVVHTLGTPWRWRAPNSEELGHWLLEVREMMLGGQQIDLADAPECVVWIRLDGKDDHRQRLRAASTRSPVSNGRVLIVADSRNPTSQHRIAGQVPGAMAIEAVELRDLIAFARDFDATKEGAVDRLLLFAKGVMTGVGAPDLIRRVATIRSGRGRTPPNETERAAVGFVEAPSNEAAARLLTALARTPSTRVHRPSVFRMCVQALLSSNVADGPTFHDAAIQARERFRHTGRTLPRRGVGSTLLLKGLEADVAVVLDADSLDARNLYVAMTRGSRSLVICSRRQVLNPRAPAA